MFDTMDDFYNYTSQAKAKADAGVISSINSKMPGSSYATPPSKCGVGGKLSTVEGSVCSDCYAKKSEAMYPSVKQGWNDNYMKAVKLIETNPMQWAKAMAFQIEKHAIKNNEPSHRWFSGGDLFSQAQLSAIVLVCELTPHIAHWLPTREAGIVKAWRKAGGVVPSNLVIRMSSTMVGDKPIAGYVNTSTVHHDGADFSGKECIAWRTTNADIVMSIEEAKAFKALSKADRAATGITLGHCGPCRACWDKSVANVSYPFH